MMEKLCVKGDVKIQHLDKKRKKLYFKLNLYTLSKTHFFKTIFGMSFHGDVKMVCAITNLSLLVSPILIFPSYGKSIGCAQEGREHTG